MPLTHACTVAGPADVPGARLLAASLRRHDPELPLTLLALPGARAQLADDEPFDVVTIRELGDQELRDAITSAGHGALGALARAALVRHLLRDDDAARIVLLPPDAELHGPLEELAARLDGHAAVLVPRVSALPDDGERPDGRDLIEAGEIDDELLAVAGGDDGAHFVDWWHERCAEGLRATAPEPPGGDHAVRTRMRPTASPLGAALRVFDTLALLEHPAYDVSHWNLHERPLARAAGGLTAAGQPLRVLRFDGFRPDRPWWLSLHSSRVSVLDDALLADLCRERAAALRDAGWQPPVLSRSGALELANKLRMDEQLARLHGEAVDEGEQFGDLLTAEGAEAFFRWLSEPAPAGAVAGINRCCYDVWRSRPDVQEAYPELDGADGEGFAGWLWVHGRAELGLDERLLPPAPTWVKGVGRPVPPVLVAGYLRGQLGLGEAGRGYVTALRAANVPVATHAVPVHGPGAAPSAAGELAYDGSRLPDGVEPEVLLMCVNAPQLPELMEQLGAESTQGKHVIGHWAWETDVIPHWWDPGFELVDEVWVNSTYVAEVLSAASTKPVVVVPTPVQAPAAFAERLPFELPGGDFLFLFAFDFLSTLQRKNPLGLVEAFKRAFRPGEGPTLLLKTINGSLRPQERDRLRWTIDGRPDIAVIDAALEPAELATLFRSADCYVSLHRSEGFGLTLAESMILGKPVVATRFGGNTDFMTPANSYLVEYEPTEVGPDAEHYPDEGTWAEPSVEHAAELLRAVWSDRDEAAARGTRARADVEASLTPKPVGAIARRRLERIAATRSAPAANGAAPPIDDVDHRLAIDLSGGNGRGGLRGLARRGMLRAIRPYTASAQQLDAALAASLRRLSVELEGARAARDRDRDRIARLERQLEHLQATQREG